MGRCARATIAPALTPIVGELLHRICTANAQLAYLTIRGMLSRIDETTRSLRWQWFRGGIDPVRHAVHATVGGPSLK